MIVRIAAVVLLFSGPGFFAYILAWIFVPAEPGAARYGEPQAPIDKKDRATQIFGVVLLCLGVSVIWGDWWAPLRGWLFPLGLMALGGWLLLRPDRDDDEVAIPPVAAVPPPVPPTPPWGWTPPAATLPITPADADLGDTEVGAAADRRIRRRRRHQPDAATLTDPADDPGADTTGSQPTTDTGAGGAGWGARPPRPPGTCPRRRCLASPSPRGRGRPPRPPSASAPPPRGSGVFGVLLIWTGVAWLAGVGLTTGLAVGLVILGLGFVLGSFVGGSGRSSSPRSSSASCSPPPRSSTSRSRVRSASSSGRRTRAPSSTTSTR
jgi:hypothetical protein